MTNSSNTLLIENVSIGYDDLEIIHSITLALQQKSIGALLGKSGCGKTTLLRAIAGFEPLRHGEIHLNGQLVSALQQQVPTENRSVGMVFQEHALFPHLNVTQNISFGLRSVSAKQKKARVAELLELVGLQHAAKLYPHQLSGGQQQRVALARALAPRPRLLLMDEPFSNLDTELRSKLAVEIRQILHHEGLSALLVTHDQHEAFAMAENIGIIHEGTLEQWDSPYHLYHQPATRFVADFIGEGVLISGSASDSTTVSTELGLLRTTHPHYPNQVVEVLIRPDDLLLDPESPISVTIEQRLFRGAEYLYTLRTATGTQLLALFPSHNHFAIGETIRIRADDSVYPVFVTY